MALLVYPRSFILNLKDQKICVAANPQISSISPHPLTWVRSCETLSQKSFRKGLRLSVSVSPLKIACFWDNPATQTFLKHRKHSSANVTSALQVKKKKRRKIGDYTKHVPSQLSVRHGKELLVIDHLVYPPASAGMFPTIYLLQLSRLDWNVWNGESSTAFFGRLYHSLRGVTVRALRLVV